jgi:hypothetical protein
MQSCCGTCGIYEEQLQGQSPKQPASGFDRLSRTLKNVSFSMSTLMSRSFANRLV